MKYQYSAMKWIICPECEGDGKVDHPAFSNGITSSEWGEMDDDEQHSYISGAYDVCCPECCGRGKLRVPDVERFNQEDKEAYSIQCEEERADAEYQRLADFERRMGC